MEEEADSEHEIAKKYILGLEEHLLEAQCHSFRLVKRQKGDITTGLATAGRRQVGDWEEGVGVAQSWGWPWRRSGRL